ncbi:hypothetical protein ACQ4N7_03050 [Nodosilinea sp. AN01ver1]|uniref:hypothetical protein n=1 Tax=Nodosilinea sp. AN01ver1 TaxID=3423362 RepID=UPI003D32259E
MAVFIVGGAASVTWTIGIWPVVKEKARSQARVNTFCRQPVGQSLTNWSVIYKLQRTHRAAINPETRIGHGSERLIATPRVGLKKQNTLYTKNERLIYRWRY